MPKLTFEELNATLDAAVEAGIIYKVDFDHLKSYEASRSLYDDIRDLRAQFMNAGKYEDRTQEELDLIEALNDSIVQFPTKKLQKLLNDAFYVGATAAVVDLVRKWEPVGDKFRTLKPMIKKGRKPSETPRKTKERTIENTGTCSCCGRNVKLNGNKIVSHGFTIRHGFQEGSCPGVGYDAVEISSEGIVAFRDMLVRMLANEKKTYEAKMNNPKGTVLGFRGNLVKADDEGYEKARRVYLMKLEGDIEWLEKAIEVQNNRIEAWKPGVLPGDLMNSAAA